jgi:hypothetical protein
MDAPETPPPAPRRRLSRRTLLRLAGGAVAAGLGAEVLRVVVASNIHTVVPGRVYRTAQLSPERLGRFIAEKGLQTVVNLRGVCSEMAWYLGECRATHAANVSQEDITFSAKRFPAPDEVRRLIDVLDHAAYPLAFHCQRGADRTGLASTVARLLLTDDTLPQARRMLWPRYGHLAVGRTAVLDAFFDYYADWLKARGEAHTPDRFRGWVANDYCPGPYRARLTAPGHQFRPAGKGFAITVRAENTSVAPWHFNTGAAGGVRLSYSLTAAGVIVHRALAGRFDRTVRPGEGVEIACGFPPLPAGTYTLHADLVDAQPIELLHTSFVQYGSEPLATPVVLV